MGRRGSGEDARALAGFLPERRGRRVRGGQRRQEPPGGGARGAGAHPGERAAAPPPADPAGEQAGCERRSDRHGTEGQDRPEEDVLRSGLVRSAVLRFHWVWSSGRVQEGGADGQTPVRGWSGQREH